MNVHAQKIMKALSDFEGFNQMIPEDILRVLRKHKDLWKDIYWDTSEDDTIYVVPRTGKADALELQFWRFGVGEEIWQEHLKIKEATDPEFEAFVRKYKGQTLLTLWWD